MVKCILMSAKLGRKEGFCPEDIFKFPKISSLAAGLSIFRVVLLVPVSYTNGILHCACQSLRTQLKSNNE